MEKAKSPFEGFWERPLNDLLQQLQTTPAGLTTNEAKQRLRQYGPNSLVEESRCATLFSILRLFANPLVIILLIASGVSLGLGDPVGGSIIIAMVLLSVPLNFFMELQARHAVEEIRMYSTFFVEYCFIFAHRGEEFSTVIDFPVRRESCVKACEAWCKPIEIRYTRDDAPNSFEPKVLE